MARPERNNVDYFPFLCKEGKAMYYIEQKYGNDGYATWIRILRQLAVTNYHFLNLRDKVEFMFLASKCRVSEEVLMSIINDLCLLKEFDETLWNDSKIIWCHKFIESIQDAYFKRNNKCITYDSLLLLLSSLGIRKLSKSKSRVSGNTHSIVKYSKEDNTKEEYVDVLFEEVFEKWLSYKSERREKYNSPKSKKSAYQKIVRLSDNDPVKADLIIEESMSNNWAGLFPLKNGIPQKVYKSLPNNNWSHG